MSMNRRRILLFACITYLVLLVAGSMGLVLIGANSLSAACHYHDALLVAVQCSDFPGSTAVSALLNFPLLLAYALMFMIAALAADHFFATLAAAVTIALWAPIAYLIVRAFKVLALPRTNPRIKC
jgi:hypothetical protein